MVTMRIFRKLSALLLAALLIWGIAGCSSKKDDGYDSEKEALLAILNELADFAGETGLDNKLQSVGTAGKLLSFLKKTTLSAGEIAQISTAWLKERTPEQQAAVKEALEKALNAAGDMLESGASQLLDAVGVDKEKLAQTIAQILEGLK